MKPILHRSLWFLALNFLFASSIFAQEQTVSATIPINIKKDPDWDWIRFENGEWLKGEIRGLERDTLEFDSDQLGVLELDWDDIDLIFSHRPMSVLTEGGEVRIGKLRTLDGKIYVGPDYPLYHENILGLALEAPRGLQLWRGNVTAGMTLRSGNVEERDVDISARFTRRTAKSTTRLSYIGNYTENGNIESANNHRTNLSIDDRVSEKWFIRPLKAEFYKDKFQNIDEQWHLGLGASFYIVENSNLLWSASFGPGYQVTRYIEVPEDDDKKSESGIFLASMEYDQELTASIDIYGLYEVTMATEESGNSKQHLTLMLDVDLIGDLDLSIGVYIDHTNDPQEDADGNFPEKTDSRISLGVTYEL